VYTTRVPCVRVRPYALRYAQVYKYGYDSTRRISNNRIVKCRRWRRISTNRGEGPMLLPEHARTTALPRPWHCVSNPYRRMRACWNGQIDSTRTSVMHAANVIDFRNFVFTSDDSLRATAGTSFSYGERKSASSSRCWVKEGIKRRRSLYIFIFLSHRWISSQLQSLKRSEDRIWYPQKTRASASVLWTTSEFNLVYCSGKIKSSAFFV